MKRTIKYLISRSKAGNTVTPLKLYPNELNKLFSLGFHEVNGKKANDDGKHQAWYAISCDGAVPGTLAAKMLKMAIKARRNQNRKRAQKRIHKNKRNESKIRYKLEQESKLSEESEVYEKEGVCCTICEACLIECVYPDEQDIDEVG